MLSKMTERISSLGNRAANWKISTKEELISTCSLVNTTVVECELSDTSIDYFEAPEIVGSDKGSVCSEGEFDFL
jgi:hypothetical protein